MKTLLIFLKNPYVLFFSILLLMVSGLSSWMNLPQLEDPRITNRNPQVTTFFPGASAERVEALVTYPLERKLQEVPEIKEVRSVSQANVSILQIELQDSVTKDTNEIIFAKIRDKLADVQSELPAGVTPSEFNSLQGASAFTMVFALTWQADSPVSWTLLQRLSDSLEQTLQQVSGTEFVKVYGGIEEEVEVLLDPEELNSFGLSVAQVQQQLQQSDVKLPSGVFRTKSHTHYIDFQAEFESTAQLSNIPIVTSENTVVRLGEIAEVRKSFKNPPEAMASTQGQPAVLVAARMNSQVRVEEWTQRVRKQVALFENTTGASVQLEEVFNQNHYTQKRLQTLTQNLLLGAGVIVLVIFVFMGWRAALIVGLALPLSLSGALFGMSLLEEPIHQMSIFGMILAIGLLIDNAIVMTDEIRRQKQQGLPPEEAMEASLHHLFKPLFASTFTTILGFMPIFLLPGNVGDFIRSIALSVVLAIMASFLLSITLIPALAARFLNTESLETQSPFWKAGWQTPHWRNIFEHWLLTVLRFPKVAVLATLLFSMVGIYGASQLSNEFFPPAERDHFELEVWLDPETSIEQTFAVTQEMEATLEGVSGIKRVDWMVGRSFPSVYYNQIMNQKNTPSYAQAIISMESQEHATQQIPVIQSLLNAHFPQAQVIVSPFGQGPPTEAPVVFRIAGPNLEPLKKYGDVLRQIMHSVPGVLHTSASINGDDAKLVFHPNESLAQLSGFTLSQMAQQLQQRTEGALAGSIMDDLEEIPVRVRTQRDALESTSDLSSQSWTSNQTNGLQRLIPTEVLGSWELEPQRNRITRLNGERVNNVYGYLAPGQSPIEVNQAILKKLESTPLNLPLEYQLLVAGESEEQQDAIRQLTTYLPLLIILMVASLTLSFNSFGMAGILMGVAFIAAGFGLLSLTISGFPLGFNPLLGLAGLIGVAINDSIVVLAAIRANSQASQGNAAAIVQAVISTSRHLLSTTFTTIGGLIPVLVLTGGSFWPPLAVVIAGGVGFATLVSMVFVPACYLWIHRWTSPSRPPVPMSKNIVSALVVLLVLTGCHLGPQYERPDAPELSIQSLSSKTEKEEVLVSEDAIVLDWWQEFQDPLLVSLVQKAQAYNHDIRIAASRVQEARFATGIQKASLWPTLNASAQQQSFRFSENGANPIAGLSEAGLADLNGEIYQAGFDASWELDFWGRNQGQVKVAQAQVLESEAFQKGTVLRILAEVSKHYVQLRGLEQLILVLERNIGLQTETLQLTQEKLKIGLSTELDVVRAQAQLKRLKAEQPRLEGQVEQTLYRLSILTGVTASDLRHQMSQSALLPTLPNRLPLGVQSDLLNRRPDIQQAEQALVASMARIGVAKADWFPRVTLVGQLGWDSTNADTLFESGSVASQFGPSIHLPLFQGGRIQANIDVQETRAQTAKLRYEQRVLMAFEEVESQLSGLMQEQRTYQRLTEALDATQNAARLAKSLYQQGLTDFLSVLEADQQLADIEMQSIQTQTQTLLQLVSLYKALGGGWEMVQPHSENW